jgi:hypothetical protein
MSAARRVLPLLFLAVFASPALAQWTQIPQALTDDVFSVWANGDTIVAGADTVTYVSTNAGGSWKKSVKVVAGAPAIEAVLLRNGRIYAGIIDKGVFVSDDLGDSWTAFNEGLTGGFLDTQLDIVSLVVRSDTLYAGTSGAGVWRRKLAPGQTWHQFGAVFEPWQASDIDDLALGGSRLLAGAGATGMVFSQDPGEPDFTEEFLNNVGIAAGLQAFDVAWWGGGWVVSAGAGVFRSANGDNPWSFTNFGLGSIANAQFAARGDGRLFGAIVHLTTTFVQTSGDGGASWQTLESLPNTFVYELAMSNGTLYAGRIDGLWRRDVSTVSVPPTASRIAFTALGAQPSSGGDLRFAFSLRSPGQASIVLYDVRGRRVAGIERTFDAGAQVAALDGSSLAPGVYVARLQAEGGSATTRVVRTR